jgi:integrase/recombinase XerD
MNKPFTPATGLRQRMIEDMNVRGFSAKTQHDYLRIVERFAAFLGRSPDLATPEDIRRFQVEQREAGMPAPAMNSHISGLRFFFTTTIDRPDLSRKLLRVSYPRKLPMVLSPDEVARLLAATTCLKHRAAVSVAYGAGLRVAEVAALKVGDIDSERMLIRVERGKGGRYRNAMLSPDLLALLRAWWKEGRRQGAMLPGGWLFPGQNPVRPITTRQLSRVVEDAARSAGITKRVSCAAAIKVRRRRQSG